MYKTHMPVWYPKESQERKSEIEVTKQQQIYHGEYKGQECEQYDGVENVLGGHVHTVLNDVAHRFLGEAEKLHGCRGDLCSSMWKQGRSGVMRVLAHNVGSGA